MNEKLVIDATLAGEIHNYISTTPTGTVPFDRVFRMLASLEQLPPLKSVEEKEAKNPQSGKKG